MGHCIQTFVAQSELAARVRSTSPYCDVFEIERGLALIPVTVPFFDSVRAKRESAIVAPFSKLNELLLETVISAMDGEKFGYIETNYVAGVGTQAGALWSEGQPLIAPTEDADVVNQVLIGLGVERPLFGKALDAFDAAGLGKIRSMDYFIAR